MTAAGSPSPRPPRASHARTRVSCLSFVFLHSLSGAVTKGYEQDVGARTSFYGFTAFSLTQSLVILGRRGFRHVPLGKVSRGERARMREPGKGEREPGALGLESAVGTGFVHTRGESGADDQAPAAGQCGVGAGPPRPVGLRAAVRHRSVSSVLRTSATCTSWKAPGTMSGWRPCS